MKPRDVPTFPRCTIDYPLEITESEIGSLTSQINTILKSTYLLGMSRDREGTFHTLFDIARETAGVDSCAYISGNLESDDFEVVVSMHLTPGTNDRSALSAPAAIARHFDKAVLLEAEKAAPFKSVCDAWNCGSLLAFPLRRDREFIGAVVFGKEPPKPFSPVDVKLLWMLAMQAENYLLQSEVVKSLSFYSFLDPLTHLHNRRYFDDQLDKEIFRSRRNGKPFSVLMIDLDGFKSYNDRFFHAAGDIVLQEFAVILGNAVREVDTVARFGGDEFAVILVESGAEGARDLANRLGEQMEHHLFPGAENTRTERISASIGIASFPADSFDKQDLLQKADRALYIAKSQGDRKLCAYHEISELLAVRQSPDDLPLQKIYDAARSVVDMDKFLEILLFTAMQGLSASRGSIVVRDSRGNFTLRTAIGFGNGSVRLAAGTQIPAGLVTSWVLENEQPLVVSGQQDMPVPTPLRKNGYRTDSFLSVPLVREGKLLGAIHLTNRKDRKPFTKADLEVFQPVAREIAAVLDQGLSFQESVKTFSTSVLHSLINALEVRYTFLSGHARRVSDIAVRVGRKLGMDTDALSSLRTAAVLHDIGIVGIPGSILSKTQRLNDKELEIVRKHSFLGSKLLEGVPGLEEMRRIVLEHHEHFDGTGYPFGLQGEEISLGARILALAEFYDSITSERPHRGKLHPEEAVQLIRNSVSTLFDGNVCQAFLEVIH
jgi:diguanylate cyclase (GGDEF)-like protein